MRVHRSIRTASQMSSDGPLSRWRFLRTPANTGPWNMALDVALARSLRPGEGVFRIYRWSRPTLSFGRNQPARTRYGGRTVDDLEGQVVRRPTGGREVLHDRELTYSVAVPSRALGGPRATYRALNMALLQAVRSLGAPAHLAKSVGPPPRPGDGDCFLQPVADEIEVDGRKLVGSAQVRLGPVLLQHGSLLLEPPSVVSGSPHPAGVSLAELIQPRVSFAEVATAVEGAMRTGLGGQWRRSRLRGEEKRVAASLVPHYESPTWTWRR